MHQLFNFCLYFKNVIDSKPNMKLSIYWTKFFQHLFVFDILNPKKIWDKPLMVISILLPSFVLQYGTFFFKWIIFPECFATPIKRTMHLKIGVIYLQNSVASMFTFGKHFGYSNTSTTVFLDYRLSNDPCPKSRARAKNYDSS